MTEAKWFQCPECGTVKELPAALQEEALAGLGALFAGPLLVTQSMQCQCRGMDEPMTAMVSGSEAVGE